MPFYTVRQGDYLPKIAKERGFYDYRTIWEDAKNKALSDKRKNPNVLAPGDELFIPDKTPKTEPGPSGQTHRFRVKTGKLLLRLIVEDLYGNPVKNAPCELRVDGELFQVVSNGEGKIEKEIPATAQDAELIVKDAETPLKEVKLKIEIGHLDPVDQPSGQKSRLSNLGYYLGALDNDDESRFKSAVEEFQCDYGLTVDGDCGPNTQAKLLMVHGC
jgi:Putative peptidoglycan binding domain